MLSKIPVFDSGSGVAFPTITPDGSVIVFSSYDDDFATQRLMSRRLINGRWSEPTQLPISGLFSDRSPAFDPAGEYLYFSSTRTTGESKPSVYNLWRVSFKNDVWGNPEFITIINSDANDYQPSLTNTGIYFCSERAGGSGGQDIYFAPYAADGFGTPKNLGPDVNSDQSEMSAFVSPTEDFMIVSTGKQDRVTLGNEDLVYFEKVEGKWQYRFTFGKEVNSRVNEYGVFVSHDKTWLYYTSDIVPPAKIYKIKLKEALKQ